MSGSLSYQFVEFYKALSHPIRLKILDVFSKQVGKRRAYELNPKEKSLIGYLAKYKP